MAPRPALLVSILLVALALLAPLVAVAVDPCPDCGPSQGCCSSQGCPCCLALTSVLTVTVRLNASSAWTTLVGHSAEERYLSSDPREIFQVPKSPLA
jgi:hypothetical protein